MAGEFLNNPLVASLGNAIGGPPLMAAMGLGGDGASSSTPPPAPKITAPVGKSTVANPQVPREFRQHAPEPRASASRGAGAQPNNGMNLPGVMSPDVLMHPAVQSLLAQYGVSPEQATAAAQQASPNMFIDNPSAFQRHPVLSGMVERGLEGLAFTHGSNTWGEGLSNVAQGLLNAKAARAEHYNNQLMMPFAQANQVAGLKQIADDQRFKEEQVNLDRSREKYYDSMGDVRGQLADIRQQQVDEQKRNHNIMANIGIDKMLANANLNPDDQEQLSQAVAAAGGNLYDVPHDTLANLISNAQLRKTTTEQTNKRAVASLGANSRVTAASISANSKPNTPESKLNEDNYKSADAALTKFKGDLSKGLAYGPDGTPYFLGGDATPAINALTKARDKAKQDWEDSNNMRVPGSGMTRKNKVPTYNPLTGKIER